MSTSEMTTVKLCRNSARVRCKQKTRACNWCRY